MIRNVQNVEDEINAIRNEVNSNNDVSRSNEISIIDLFTSKELRWALITSLVLQLTQQLSGINAVFKTYKKRCTDN
jgi:hypothetical protein